MKLRDLCNVFKSWTSRCSANKIGRSRVISCHLRDIGVDCSLFRNHYKDHGRDYVQYHDLEWYPSVLN
jgi:hypothetical protein